MFQALRRDRVFRLALVVFVAIALLFVFPPVDRDTLGRFVDYGVDPALILLAIVAFQYRLNRIEVHRAKRFWNWMTMAFVAWLLVEVLYFLVPDTREAGPPGLIIEFLYLCYYSFLLLAIHTAPHRESETESTTLRRIESVGMVVFALGLVLYFLAIPQRLDPTLYGTIAPSLFVYAVLDGFLLVLFINYYRSCTSRPWKAIYAWLGITSLLWCILELVEYSMETERIRAVPFGTVLDLFWLAPLLTVIVAARLQHQANPEVEEPKPGHEPGRSRRDAVPSYLILYALAFPVLHFSIYAFGFSSPTLRSVREVCVLMCVMVLGGLAFLRERLVQRHRKRTESALRQTEERLRSVITEVPIVMWVIDSDGIFTLSEGKGLEGLGLRPGEAVGQSVFELYRDEERLLASIGRVLSGQSFSSLERVGTLVFETHYSPLHDATGNINGASGISVDITRRDRLESQLRQSQRVESVGRLAGGVAHDFNNLLTVVNGYAELLEQRLEANDPALKDVEQIRRAGEHAASLTRQLLAFSRRQILQPRVLNVNTVVADMSKMLRRLIGEDINFVTRLLSSPGRVMADPGQIEQVIINLSLNARDALAPGGTLTIETGNVHLTSSSEMQRLGLETGSYVLLTVSDNGHGMNEAISSRIFEPYFSTKDEGTGLGLSTVYGIVKQSGGAIRFESEPGRGTTFTLYLPELEKGSGLVESTDQVAAPMSGSETLLLVEDENEVRTLARRILEGNGYSVLEARNGDEALSICEEHAHPIQLLLTDVVMPGISGREVATRVAALYPDIKVLYTSGYPDDAIGHHGVLDEGTPFLEKPFDKLTLTRKVREVLDSA